MCSGQIEVPLYAYELKLPLMKRARENSVATTVISKQRFQYLCICQGCDTSYTRSDDATGLLFWFSRARFKQTEQSRLTVRIFNKRRSKTSLQLFISNALTENSKFFYVAFCVVLCICGWNGIHLSSLTLLISFLPATVLLFPFCMWDERVSLRFLLSSSPYVFL